MMCGYGSERVVWEGRWEWCERVGERVAMRMGEGVVKGWVWGLVEVYEGGIMWRWCERVGERVGVRQCNQVEWLWWEGHVISYTQSDKCREAGRCEVSESPHPCLVGGVCTWHAGGDNSVYLLPLLHISRLKKVRGREGTPSHSKWSNTREMWPNRLQADYTLGGCTRCGGPTQHSPYWANDGRE